MNLMAHQQTAPSSGMKDHTSCLVTINTTYTEIIGDGDVEHSSTPDWEKMTLQKQSYCSSELSLQNRKAVIYE